MSDVRTWRYRLPYCQKGDGGTFFIDSTGVFLAYSAYGAYGYRWTHPDPCIRAFIAQLNADYVYRKLLSGRLQKLEPFDGYATMRRVRTTIFEIESKWRREAELELLQDFGKCFDDERRDFDLWLGRTHLDEAWNFAETRRDSECWAFCTLLLPRLQARLRFDLQRERADRAGQAILNAEMRR